MFGQFRPPHLCRQHRCHIGQRALDEIGEGIEHRRDEHVSRGAPDRVEMQVQSLPAHQCTSGQGLCRSPALNCISCSAPITSSPGRSRSSGSMASEA